MAFNKMMIMLPMVFAVRKLDGEDPDVVFMLRCAYFGVQGVILLSVLYIYMCAAKLGQSEVKDQDIYVPPPPQPFADPNAKTQYTKTTIGEHAVASAKKLLMSTVTGIFMTLGLHWYKGMVIGLAMQAVMGPFNLLENVFAKSILLGESRATEKSEEGEAAIAAFKRRRMFGEKYRDELTEKDEVIDSEGRVIVLKKEKGGKKGSSKSKDKSFEDLLLDTWDDGTKADIAPLVKQLNKGNANYKTKESGWSPLMILCAIGAEGSTDAIKKMKSLNASATMKDKEGWNALHWAAFHGSEEGAKTLMEVFDGMKLGLHLVKDLEGMTAMDHAIKEGNSAIASYIKDKMKSAIETADSATSAMEDPKTK